MPKKDNLEKSVEEGNEGPRKLLSEEDGKKYCGKYVAVASFNSKEVIAYGKNPAKVAKEAYKKVKEPVIFFVPDPDVTYIYNAA